jgi:hypothetical protein
MRNLTQTLSIKGFQMRPLVDVVKKAIAAIKRMGGSRYEVPEDFGLVLGVELVTNGDFVSTVGWGTSVDAGGNVSFAGEKCTLTNTTGTARVAQTVAFQTGKTYRVQWSHVGANIGAYSGSSESLGTSTAGQNNRVLVATANSNQIGFRNFGAGTSAEIDNVSIREILSASSYIDSIGATPVTAVGDLVGLEFDSMRTLGPELITTPFNQSPWVTKGSLSTITTNSFTNTSGVGAGRAIPGLLDVNKSYTAQVSFVKSDAVTEFGVVPTGSPAWGTSVASSGTITGTIRPGNTEFYLRLGGNATVTITSITLREVTGNHATQATTANKPVVALGPRKTRPELVGSPLNFLDSVSWNTGLTASATTNSWTVGSAGGPFFQLLTAGKTYVLEVIWTATASVTQEIRNGNSGTSPLITNQTGTSGTLRASFTALSQYVYMRTGGGATVTISKFSVREVTEFSNVLRFDGTNDLLSFGKAVLDNSSDHWVSAAFESRTSAQSTQAQIVFGVSSTASVTPLVCQLHVEQTTRLISAAWRGDNGTLVLLVGPAVPINSKVIATAARIGNTGYLWYNGLQVASLSLTGVGTTTCNTTTIGATVRTTTSSYFGGDIYDLAYAQATLTESDRKTIEAAMAKKIAITL